MDAEKFSSLGLKNLMVKVNCYASIPFFKDYYIFFDLFNIFFKEISTKVYYLSKNKNSHHILVFLEEHIDYENL